MSFGVTKLCFFLHRKLITNKIYFIPPIKIYACFPIQSISVGDHIVDIDFSIQIVFAPEVDAFKVSSVCWY